MVVMTPEGDSSVAVEPWACLIVLVARRWAHPLTPLLSQAQTEILARHIAALSEPQRQAPCTTLAVLGQLYHADQLCTSPVLADFAQHAYRCVTTTCATSNALSVLPVARDASPRFPAPWVLPRDPTEVPQARGGYVRILGLPCALVGPSVAWTQPLLPTPVHPVPCPALTACVSRLLEVEATQILFFSWQRPEMLASWVNNTRGYVRSVGDLAEATLHAQRRTAPVRATAVCYGTAGTLEYLTLTITDAATYHVLRTYRYHAHDFPGRSAEVDRFFQRLSFAWGAIEYVLLPTLHPVRCDATGTLLADEPPAVPPSLYPIPGNREHSH